MFVQNMLDVIEVVFYLSSPVDFIRSSISCCEFWRLTLSSASDFTTSSIRVFTEDSTDSNMALNIRSCIGIISLKVATNKVYTNSEVGSESSSVEGFEDLGARVSGIVQGKPLLCFEIVSHAKTVKKVLCFLVLCWRFRDKIAQIKISIVKLSANVSMVCFPINVMFTKSLLNSCASCTVHEKSS